MTKSNFHIILSFFVATTLTQQSMAQGSVCVKYGELVALKIYLPNGVGFYYLAGEGSNIYASRSPHYQWKFEIHPEQTPYAGECISHANDFAIYNAFTGSYMVKSNGGVILTTQVHTGLYMWRCEGTELLEKFKLRMNIEGKGYQALVIDYNRNLGFEAYGQQFNMQFFRVFQPVGAEVNLSSLRDISNNIDYYANREPWVYSGDDDLVSPPVVENYWDPRGTNDFQTPWWLENYRSTLKGTLEKYHNYILEIDLGPFGTINYPENDWNLDIYPDPGYELFIDNNYIGLNADHVRSENQAHPGAVLVQCEVTPSRSIWDQFPWLPISASEEYHTSPLINKKINVYGVYCVDGAHGYKPEIHPMDAIWWKDWEYEHSGQIWLQKWYLGCFHDGSHRFTRSWSEKPRVLYYNFPFYVEVPNENETQVEVNFNIDATYSNNINTTQVLGPDEDNAQRIKIIKTSNHKSIKVSVDERYDAFQNIQIFHTGRAGNKYFGVVRVSVAVGNSGFYFGSCDIETTRQGTPPIEAVHLISEGVFKSRTFEGAQLWDRYEIQLNAEGGYRRPSPDTIQLIFPEQKVVVPFGYNDTIQTISIWKEGNKYTQKRPVLESAPALRIKMNKAQASLPIPSGASIEKISWRRAFDVYVNPRIMKGGNYPYWINLKVNWISQKQIKYIDCIIKDIQKPTLKFQLVDQPEPKVYGTGQNQTLEFDLNIQGVPQNVGKSVKWEWNFTPSTDELISSLPDKKITLSNSDKQNYKLRIGDPDRYLSAKAIDNNEIEANSTLSIPGIKLWGSVKINEDLNSSSQLKNTIKDIQSFSMKVSLLKIFPELGAVNATWLKPTQVIGTTLKNAVVFNGFAGYFPYRNGRIYAEEESEFTKMLNKILSSKEDKYTKKRQEIFGNNAPLKFKWDVEVLDLQGHKIPVSYELKNFKNALSEANKKKQAFVFPISSLNHNDQIAIALPKKEFFTIKAKATITDPFGQIYIYEKTTYNFQISNFSEGIKRIARFNPNGLMKILPKNQLVDYTTNEVEPMKINPNNLLYSTAYKKFKYYGQQKVSPEEFKSYIMSLQQIYKSVTTAQRAEIFKE